MFFQFLTTIPNHQVTMVELLGSGICGKLQAVSDVSQKVGQYPAELWGRLPLVMAPRTLVCSVAPAHGRSFQGDTGWPGRGPIEAFRFIFEGTCTDQGTGPILGQVAPFPGVTELQCVEGLSLGGHFKTK